MIFNKYKYKWRVLDKYGREINNRERNLYTILECSNEIDEIDDICLIIAGFSTHSDRFANTVLYNNENKVISIQGTSFKTIGIEDAENLIDRWIEANPEIELFGQ
jgi:hypothetical protein